jgi:outer membrane biosynthesis protein TonB
MSTPRTGRAQGHDPITILAKAVPLPGPPGHHGAVMGEARSAGSARAHASLRRSVVARCLATLALGFATLVLTAGPAAADSVSASVSPMKGKPGDLVVMTATVQADECAGVTVIFRIGSGPSASRVTDASCFASASVVVPTAKPCPSNTNASATTKFGSDSLVFTIECAPPPKPKPTKSAKPTPTPTPTPEATPTPKASKSPKSKPKPSAKATKSPASPQASPSPTPTPTPSPTPTPTGSTAALAPLVPLDDGGPQPPTGGGGSRLGYDAAALAVLLLGTLAAVLLWRRAEPSRQQVGGAVTATLVVTSGVLVLPLYLQSEPAPSTTVRLRTITAEATVEPLSTASANATCPAGTVLVGGGARTNLTEGSDLRLTASRPTTDGWEAAAIAPGDAPLTLTAVALCTTDVGAATQIATSDQIVLSAGTVERVNPRCPGDDRPMALGYDTGDGRAVAALPLAHGGALAAWSGQAPTSARATLLCTTSKTTAYVVRHEGEATEIPDGDAGEAKATCASGSQAISGGYVAAASVGGRLAEVTVLSAAPSSDRYVVVAAAPQGQGGIQLTAYALCLPTE